MKDRIIRIVSNKTFITIIYILFALFASLQSLVLGTKTFYKGGIEYSTYSNYTIFERSFHHLKNGQDLYVRYPHEQSDLYKYTPAFSVFFGLFAMFPDWIGLTLWNLLNALVVLLAVYYLPKLSLMEKGLILMIVSIVLLTSLQNSQSNGLIAGLLVLSFGLLENKKYLLAALCIVFSVYIKIFGIAVFAIFLFYPQKWKLALYSLLWIIVFFLVPFVFVNINQYMSLFQSYSAMLCDDHSNSLGYSVMGWLNSWFCIESDKNIVVLTGLVVLMAPFLRVTQFRNFTFRYLALASVLIWIVIFNHKAESSTFIIAMTGIALWFISCDKSTFNIVLFSCAFILTALSPTDIFPEFIREEYVNPYTLSAFPCIVIWTKIVYDMIVLRKDKISENFDTQHRILQ